MAEYIEVDLDINQAVDIEFGGTNAKTARQARVNLGIPDGAVTGDIIRWNAATEEWEVKAEPLSFAGIKLTPQEAALMEEEGVIYYSSIDKAVLVCTDV